jgi:hypothetical protein
MPLGFPKPLKGWRVFAGEVGTIVLGVLIALGAQEFVQSLHWKREVGETRKSLDAELSRDLAAYQYRVSQRQCVDDRLTELRRWAASLRSGRPMTIRKAIEAPPGFKVRTAAWEVTDGEIASRIPIDAKMAYAGIYDAMRTFDEMINNEQDQWTSLVEMQSGTTYTEADIRTIERATRLLGVFNQAIPGFAKTIDPLARKLGIGPEANIEGSAHPIIAQWRKEVCKPLL